MGNIISVVLHLSCIICRNNVTHVKGPNKPWLLWFFFSLCTLWRFSFLKWPM